MREPLNPLVRRGATGYEMASKREANTGSLHLGAAPGQGSDEPGRIQASQFSGAALWTRRA
jgi:hypothetical protein